MPTPRGMPRCRSASTPGRIAEAMTTASRKSRTTSLIFHTARARITSKSRTSDETRTRRAISRAVNSRTPLGMPGVLRDVPGGPPWSPAAVFDRIVGVRKYGRHVYLSRVALPHEDVEQGGNDGRQRDREGHPPGSKEKGDGGNGEQDRQRRQVNGSAEQPGVDHVVLHDAQAVHDDRGGETELPRDGQAGRNSN